MNPWCPLHVSTFGEESIPVRSRYSEVHYAFAVKGFFALFLVFEVFSYKLVMTFKPRSGTQFLGCTFHLPSAETNLTPICTSPKLFVCNLPDSERHMTRPNQGLSTGRRGNLGMRLFTNQVKRKFEFPVTPLEAQSKDFGTASQTLHRSICTLCP